MFDINEIINKELTNQYKIGRLDMLNEIMEMLSKHNASNNNTYIPFVEELLDLNKKEKGGYF